MTISQIEAFLTLAETLNFTKASAVLHTTQPNLSKIVMNLEQEVGVHLLNRSKRHVRLTPAGEAFRGEMLKLMEHYRHAVNKAKETASGIQGAIEIGFLGTALIHQLPKIVNLFREKHPDILLHLADYTYSRLMEALAENSVDVALLPDRELEHMPNYSKKLLYADAMCLVVGKAHPCAGRESVDLPLVRDEPFVMMDPKVSIRDYELVSHICMEQGFVSQVAYEANTLNSLIMMVECGIGVSILARHMARFSTENVRFVKINGYENYFRVSCAWREGANPCVPHFLNILDQYFSG